MTAHKLILNPGGGGSVGGSYNIGEIITHTTATHTITGHRLLSMSGSVGSSLEYSQERYPLLADVIGVTGTSYRLLANGTDNLDIKTSSLATARTKRFYRDENDDIIHISPTKKYKSTDEGLTWTQDTTWTNPFGSHTSGVVTKAARANVYYHAAQRGLNKVEVFKSTDGGQSWTDLTGNIGNADPNSGIRNIQNIVCNDTGTKVRISGHQTNVHQHILYSSNGGASWTDSEQSSYYVREYKTYWVSGTDMVICIHSNTVYYALNGNFMGGVTAAHNMIGSIVNPNCCYNYNTDKMYIYGASGIYEFTGNISNPISLVSTNLSGASGTGLNMNEAGNIAVAGNMADFYGISRKISSASRETAVNTGHVGACTVAARTTNSIPVYVYGDRQFATLTDQDAGGFFKLPIHGGVNSNSTLSYVVADPE